MLRDAVRVTASSFLVSILCVLLNKAIFSFGNLTVWIALDLAFEALLVLLLYTFVPSLPRVLAVQAILGTFFRFANSFKVRQLGIPIVAGDLFLLGDLYQVLPSVMRGVVVVAPIVVIVACAALLIPIVRRPRGLRWSFTIPSILVVGWIFAAPTGFSAWIDSLLTDPTIATPFMITEKEQTIGVPLSFALELSRYLELRRTIPGPEQVQQALESLGNPKPAGAPPPLDGRDVYVILVESFWDPSVSLGQDGFPFLAADFRWLWTSHGRRWLATPTYGGGTANTEFEVLCGIPARAVDRGVVFQSGIGNPMPCLPRVLAQSGYKAYAFHPFAGGYYNRKVALPLLGFDRFFAIEDLRRPDEAGKEFLEDRTFLDRSIEFARSSSGGKPFLAYMMTFAGHWPYAWLDDYGSRIRISSSAPSRDLDVLERELNVNLYSSRVLAETVRRLRKEDPRALIVIAGDHLPGFANQLANAGQGVRDISEARFFETPLLYLDGNESEKDSGVLAAYEIPHRILHSLSSQDPARGPLHWFHRGEHLYRPIPGGAVLVMDPATGGEKVCTPRIPNCEAAIQWFQNARILGRDLAYGMQYSQQLARPRGGNATPAPASDSGHGN